MLHQNKEQRKKEDDAIYRMQKKRKAKGIFRMKIRIG